MKYTAIINREEQLSWLSGDHFCEVILYHERYSREGGLAEREIETLVHKAQERGFDVALQIDRLVEEKLFEQIFEACMNVPQDCVLRVQDLGLAHALFEQQRPFDLILEAGHANAKAIESWVTLLKKSVRRVVINHEIPKRNLHPILSRLEMETETLGFGPLIMYYSPRSLLSFAGQSEKDSLIRSDEMGAGSYRLKESQAGTVMYYNKDLSLLRYLDELDRAGLNLLRLDLRECEYQQFQALCQSIQERSDQSIKESWLRPLLHGFYGENKSDSIFDRLSTKQIEREKEPFAEVIDQTKTRLLVRTWLKDLELPLSMKAKDGKGRWHEWEVSKVESLSDRQEKASIDDEVFLLERPRRFPSGTLLYRA